MTYNTKKRLRISKNKTKKQFLFNPRNPKKSFDVYIDKNPKDTIPIKYTTIEDVKNTIDKLENLYKHKKYTHKRIWQVGMIMKVRLGVLRKKKPKQYALANKYFIFLGKRTKLDESERYKFTFTTNYTSKNRKRRGGGLIDNKETTPPNGANRSFHTKVEIDGKEYEVDYLIPYTINLKNPNSKRVPAFSMKMNKNNEVIKASMILHEKYVDYFVRANGTWYAMMRLGLLTINSGVFAAYTNVLFYKFNAGIMDLETGTNQLLLTVDEGLYKEIPNTSWGIFKDSDTHLIQLNDDQVVPITSESSPEEFTFLQRYRNEQILNFLFKMKVQEEGVRLGFDVLKGLANA